MNISISDLTNLINNNEKCHELTDCFGKVIIMKNNQPDSVLLPIAEYERLLKALEKSDNKTDIIDFVKRLPPAGNREVYTLAQLKYDLYQRNEIIRTFFSVGNRKIPTTLTVKTKGEKDNLEREGDGSIPTYTHSDVTDALYDVFGYRTDLELLPRKKMKRIEKLTKKQK
ncbi:MAG: hypothetical protein SCM11_02240 [Bacillota bacterium]|nr:hypothetical protein [Bacillota bacterium]